MSQANGQHSGLDGGLWPPQHHPVEQTHLQTQGLTPYWLCPVPARGAEADSDGGVGVPLLSSLLLARTEVAREATAAGSDLNASLQVQLQSRLLSFDSISGARVITGVRASSKLPNVLADDST